MPPAKRRVPPAPIWGPRTDRELVPASGNKFEKPKKQAIKDLGLSTSQVSRMEQMAVHPDIVEKVIAESQARGGKFPVPSKGGVKFRPPSAQI